MLPPALAMLARRAGAVVLCQGGSCPASGGTRVLSSLSRGAGSPYHDTLSPRWGEPAVPAPPATHTIISAGRAEASVIIGSDSLALERCVPGARQDFPAGLVCEAGWHPSAPAAVQPCGAWLAPSRRSGAGRGRGGERRHCLRFVPQHALAPPPPPKRHSCGLVLGCCWHRR